jgi:hypothetical protein
LGSSCSFIRCDIRTHGYPKSSVLSSNTSFLDTTDFQPGFGTVVFRPNDTEACGQVPIKDDTDPENPEVFMVTFMASNLIIPRPRDLPLPIAEVTIIDDDSMFITLIFQIYYLYFWSGLVALYSPVVSKFLYFQIWFEIMLYTCSYSNCFNI